MCFFAEEARLRAEQEELERLERERKEKELAALEKNVNLLLRLPKTVTHWKYLANNQIISFNS